MRRRDLFKAAAGAAAFAAVKSPAVAQSAWPQKDRTIKVIVPWPPGAANDALGRLLAERLQDKYGVTADRREPRRRRGSRRHQGRHSVGSRRLHVPCQRLQHRGDADGAEVGGLQSGNRSRRAGAHRGGAARLRHERKPAGKDLGRGRRLRQGRSEEVELRHLLARLGRASGDDRVHPPHRRQHRHGALSRHAAGAHRPHGRLGPAADRSELRAAAGGARTEPRCARSASRRSSARCSRRMCRPWPRPVCPASSSTPGTACGRRRDCRPTSRRRSTAWCRIRCAILRSCRGFATTLIEPVAESIDDTKAFIRSEIVRAGELLKSVNFQPS